MSFGFKYGVPVDADLVADVRFLPNPFLVPELREKPGCRRRYPTTWSGTRTPGPFLDQYSALLDLIADGYLREGKRYVTIAIGCTGGKHRSVAMAEHLGGSTGEETALRHW